MIVAPSKGQKLRARGINRKKSAATGMPARRNGTRRPRRVSTRSLSPAKYGWSVNDAMLSMIITTPISRLLTTKARLKIGRYALYKAAPIGPLKYAKPMAHVLGTHQGGAEGACDVAAIWAAIGITNT